MRLASAAPGSGESIVRQMTQTETIDAIELGFKKSTRRLFRNEPYIPRKKRPALLLFIDSHRKIT
ncbi:hypothetical protein [Burkholderia latens]|uniref:Uncharacterized protein n=1 Tax=Burkholderia latens TaxID=488446 RepID=A0A6H9TCU1_9BURK|nr:hypothetical protein [Burkholderia latens]KAB0642504.1 hypothetical protein F7R21_11470 [Burkholderia latens]